jgi:superfamily I DNA/RNA helicase
LCFTAHNLARDPGPRVGQRIYPTTFAWRDLGLDIVGGGRSRHLPHTHRATQQIARFVHHLRAQIPEMADEEPVIPDATGPLPIVHAAPDAERERTVLMELIRSLRKADPQASIAVLARKHALLDRTESALMREGIRYVSLSGHRDATGVSALSAGVKLCTFHSAKGLEFDHVIAFHVEEGAVPPAPEPNADAEDIAEQHAHERRLLYVALSRPRLTLHITHAANPSRFLQEIPSEAYQRVSYPGTPELND